MLSCFLSLCDSASCFEAFQAVEAQEIDGDYGGDDYYLPDDDLPMTWAQAGNEVPVIQDDPPEVTDPVARETLRRYDILCQCWLAAGIEPTEEQRAEAMRTINAGVLIDFAMGRIK